MNKIVHIPAPTVLTQGHRRDMAYIQELAITISMLGVYSVSAEYTGVGHAFRVSVLLFSELAKENFKALKSFCVYLPGLQRLAGNNSLEELQSIARELEALLIPPTGGSAA